eukprot:1182008-Prorocentrum_minimum.AAC.1
MLRAIVWPRSVTSLTKFLGGDPTTPEANACSVEDAKGCDFNGFKALHERWRTFLKESLSEAEQTYYDVHSEDSFQQCSLWQVSSD